MEASKSEMAFIKFTLPDFEEMIKREVARKWPHLIDSKVWEWEDMVVSSKLQNLPSMKEGDVALELVFAKHKELLPSVVDKRPDVVYVAVQDVCR